MPCLLQQKGQKRKKRQNNLFLEREGAGGSAALSFFSKRYFLYFLINMYTARKNTFGAGKKHIWCDKKTHLVRVKNTFGADFNDPRKGDCDKKCGTEKNTFGAEMSQ